MKRNRNGSWRLLGLAVLAMAAAGLTPLAASSSADEEALRAATTAWGKAYNAGDAKGVAALYADDALLMPPGSPGVKGRAAIEAFFVKDIAGAKAGKVVMDLNPKTEVGIVGDTGWESGTYQATVDGAVVESGKFLSVSKKVGGKWLYIRDTWNADAPPAPAK